MPKFIDPKRDKLHTFKVVHRSQKDPLAADEKAPQSVLVAVPSRKKKLQEYGVYFDDDYNYLQHLRGIKETSGFDDRDIEVHTVYSEKIRKQVKNGLNLPSSVFESAVEEPIGLLNKAAPITGPQPQLDPDIVALLDSDSEEENDGNGMEEDQMDEEFPDDYFLQLNAKNPQGDYGDPSEGEAKFDSIHQWLGRTKGEDNDAEFPDIQEVDKDSFFRQYEDAYDSDDELASNAKEALSSFKSKAMSRASTFRTARTSKSHRSMASSCTLARSEQLTILDEMFESVYSTEYDDDRLGALEGDVIEGPAELTSEIFHQAVDSTKRQIARAQYNESSKDEKSRTVHWIKENMRLKSIGEVDEALEKLEEVVVKKKPTFDCESILSTYSTTSNIPHLADDSFLFSRKKLSKKAVRDHDLADGTHKERNEDAETDAVTLLSCISALSMRPKGETKEESKERRSALKELRRERRKEKKINTLAFKDELKLQKKQQFGQIVIRAKSLV